MLNYGAVTLYVNDVNLEIWIYNKYLSLLNCDFPLHLSASVTFSLPRDMTGPLLIQYADP